LEADVLGKLKQVKAHHVAIFGGVVSTIGYQLSSKPELLQKFIGEAANNQIIQTGFFFTVAAWLHSGQVKNEIRINFQSLTEAINNVATSLREDLKKHSDELVKLSVRVQTVENNLNTLKEPSK
jgi:hypothetical protein